MNKFLLLGFFQAILLISQQHSFAHDGDEFLKQCSLAVEGKNQSREDVTSALWCLWYMSNINNIHSFHDSDFREDKTFCLPAEDLSASQKLNVVLQYIKDHPETQNQSVDLLILKSFVEAYPCK